MSTKSFKMHDILQIEDGSLVMVRDIAMYNDEYQYSISLVSGNNSKVAWFKHSELCYIGNPVSDFLKIQERLNE